MGEGRKWVGSIISLWLFWCNSWELMDSFKVYKLNKISISIYNNINVNIIVNKYYRLLNKIGWWRSEKGRETREF